MNEMKLPADLPEEVKKAIEAGYAKQSQPVYLTEKIALPSKGKLYPPDSPLASGFIELRYPTAKDEDILTSKQLLQNGTVVDVFVNNLIVDKRINAEDLLVGDKNALVLSARILAYGPKYEVEITCPNCGVKKKDIIDISQFESKELPILDTIEQGKNEFSIVLPISKYTVTYKIPTVRDDNKIDAEIKAMKKHKVDKKIDNEITTRLRNYIVSVTDPAGNPVEQIRSFVDNLPTSDSLALRTEIRKMSPNVDTDFNFECDECGHEGRMSMPLGIGFFWPSTDSTD